MDWRRNTTEDKEGKDMNQNIFDELNRQKIEIRKSAKKAEYKRKKQRERRNKYVDSKR